MIAYDNSAGYYTVTGTTLTQSFTVGTGSNRFLVVNALTNGTVTGVTYGGVAMTKTSEGAVTASGDSFSNTLWYLFAPASGANNVVITCSGSASIYTHFSSYKGVLQSGLNTSGTANTAGATSLAISLTTTLDNCWLIGSTRIPTGGTVTAGTNTTMRSVDHTGDIGDTNSAQTPAGSYSLNVNNSASSAITWLALAIAPAPATFKTATVSAGDVPATQTDFPVYVDLTRMNGGTALSLAEAQSIRVYADSGKTTEWAREIVSATEMHVKIPSLTSTTSIYVEWDGVRADYAVTDTYGRNAVWSGYNAVYHMETLVTDYTGNGYTLTDVNTVGQVAGKLNGLAGDFEKTNSESLDISSAVGATTTSSFAVSCWFTVESAPSSGGYHSLLAQYIDSGSADKGWRMGYENNAGTLRLRFYKFGTGTIFLDTNITLTTGSTWYHAYFTWDGSTIRAYKDGAEYANGANTGTSSATASTSFNISRNGAGGGDHWDGLIDEVRLYNNVLSADWITTEYNNQSDEAGFWGTWTDAGGATQVGNLMLLGVG